MARIILIDFRQSSSPSLNRLGNCPQIIDDRGMPVESLNSYLRNFANNWAICSRKTYSEQLCDFFSFLEGLKLDISYVTDDHIGAYADAMCSIRKANDAGLAWKTIDARIRTVRRFFEWASRNDSSYLYKHSLITPRYNYRGLFNERGHPAQPIRRKVKFVEIDQAKKFIRAQKGAAKNPSIGERNSVIASIIASTGLRISEALNLRVSDIPGIQFEKEVYYVEIIGKGRVERSIEMPLDLLRDIHRYISIDREKILEKFSLKNKILPKELFITTNGKALTRCSLEAIFRKLSNSLGMKVRPHWLRHTFATYHYKNNNDLQKVSQLLGHASISFTAQTYVGTIASHAFSKEHRVYLERLLLEDEDLK